MKKKSGIDSENNQGTSRRKFLTNAALAGAAITLGPFIPACADQPKEGLITAS